jgi:hypothetical protein
MEITRRSMLVGAAVATGVTTSALAEWAPNAHYPDPAFKVLDPSFLRYRPSVVGVERLATGLTWSDQSGLAMGAISLSHLERHSQQPPDALGRGHGRSWGVPRSIKPSER